MLHPGPVTAFLAAAAAAASPALHGDPWPAELELSSMWPGGDGSDGFVVRSVNDYRLSDLIGSADINGDGIDDLIIGTATPYEARGLTFVVFGRATGFPAVFPLSSLLPGAGGDGSAGFVLVGTEPGDRAGGAVSGTGDVNGDGIEDLIIGAKGTSPAGKDDAGTTYVVFGRLTPFPAVFPLSRLHPATGGDGSEGFLINGIVSGDESGVRVAAAGDVNADRIGDILIGAFRANGLDGPVAAGEAYVVFGRSTGFPPILGLGLLLPAPGGDGSEGFQVLGARMDGELGSVIGGGGDLNGDGVGDLVVGAELGLQRNSPERYVIFGRTDGFPAQLRVTSLFAGLGDGSRGFIPRMPRTESVTPFNGRAGIAGDVNGDGRDDLITAGTIGVNENRVYVLLGRDQFEAMHPLGAAEHYVESDSGTLNAIRQSGDVNGDGIADIVVTDREADIGPRQDAGQSYVFFGDSNLQQTLLVQELLVANGGDGSEGFAVNGPFLDAFAQVTGIGDINGDGIDELLVLVEKNAVAANDSVYVVFGRAATAP